MRMRASLVAAVLGAGAIAAVGLGGGSASGADRCAPRGGTVVKRTAEVVICRRPRPEARRDDLYHGCARSRGKVVRLNRVEDRLVESIDPRSITVAGTQVAFIQNLPGGGPAADSVRAVVFNLRTARWHTSGGEHELPAIVLRRDGVATITSLIVADPQNPVRRVIQLLPTGENRVLDTGPGIQLESLALSADRRTVYWLNGDEPRSAPAG